MTENNEYLKKLSNPSNLEGSLENNAWLRKILNSANAVFFQDLLPLKCSFQFGPDLVPNKVTLLELAKDIRKDDLVWIPLNVAFSAALAHRKHRGFCNGILCLFLNAYARLGGFEEHRKKYGSEAYFKQLEAQKMDTEKRIASA